MLREMRNGPLLALTAALVKCLPGMRLVLCLFIHCALMYAGSSSTELSH